MRVNDGRAVGEKMENDDRGSKGNKGGASMVSEGKLGDGK